MITIIVIMIYTKPAILYPTKSEYIPIFRPKKKSVILSNLNPKKKKQSFILLYLQPIHDVPSVRQHHQQGSRGNRRYNQIQYYTLQVSQFFLFNFHIIYFSMAIFFFIYNMIFHGNFYIL
jgi:hypothetical protein